MDDGHTALPSPIWPNSSASTSTSAVTVYPECDLERGQRRELLAAQRRLDLGGEDTPAQPAGHTLVRQSPIAG